MQGRKAHQSQRLLTSCREQGHQQLLHLRGLFTVITSVPALSEMCSVQARSVEQKVRSKQMLSSTAK